MPFSGCHVYEFKTSKFPECVLLLEKEGGILITCDCIHNWLKHDQYFDMKTTMLLKVRGAFGEAHLNPIWRNACEQTTDHFQPIVDMTFKHLMSAHGAVLLNHAREKLIQSIAEVRDR